MDICSALTGAERRNDVVETRIPEIFRIWRMSTRDREITYGKI